MAARPSNVWIVWITLAVALLLSVSILPGWAEPGRPMWLALFLTYWLLAVPHRVGMTTAWCCGLLADVLNGTPLGQNALALMLISFMVLSLHQRMRMFPMWQQSMVLLMVFGIAQLVQLWLNALVGSRPPTLQFVLPALISALLWPWVCVLLRSLHTRLRIN